MKYILINYSYVVAAEDDKLEETKDLILHNDPKANLIVEDTAEACMSYVRLGTYSPVNSSSLSLETTNEIDNLITKLIINMCIFAVEGTETNTTSEKLFVGNEDEWIENIETSPQWSVSRFKEVSRVALLGDTKVLPSYITDLRTELLSKINSLCNYPQHNTNINKNKSNT